MRMPMMRLGMQFTCHLIAFELGYSGGLKWLRDVIVKPSACAVTPALLCGAGEVLFGTDSHTCNAGAFGQFATGVGNTDAGFILGTGKLLIKVRHWSPVCLEWYRGVALLSAAQPSLAPQPALALCSPMLRPDDATMCADVPFTLYVRL